MISCMNYLPLSSFKETNKVDRVCCICFEKIRDEETRYERMNKIVFFFSNKRSKHTLPCGHSFHSSCIHKWMNVNLSCPICRQRMKRKQRKSEDMTEENICQRLEMKMVLFMQRILTTCSVPIYFIRGDSLTSIWLLLCVFPNPITILTGVILVWYNKMVCDMNVFLLLPLLFTLALNTLFLLMKSRNWVHDRNQSDIGEDML